MNPVRTCIGCGETAPRDRLLRLIRGPDGAVALDPDKSAPGRGAWVHPRASCLERAEGPRAIGRAFKGRARPAPPGELRSEALRILGALEEE